MNEMHENEHDDAERLRRMLEDVTAGGADRAPRDADGLRDAWLAFGRLLEAADSASSTPKVEFARKRKPSYGRYIAAVAAVAAAVCIVVGIGWRFLGNGLPNHKNEPVVKQQTPQPPSIVPAPQPKSVVHNDPNDAPTGDKKSVPKQTAVADNSAWDDTIDTQITSISNQIDSVRQVWQHRVDDVDLLQYRIDEVSAAMQKDSL